MIVDLGGRRSRRRPRAGGTGLLSDSLVDLAERAGHDLPGGQFDLRVATHLREHLLYMRLNGRSWRAMYCRRRGVVLLAECLGDDPATATYERLLAWQLHRLQSVSLTTVSWDTGIIRPYYRWLHEHGLRPDNPAARLPKAPVPRGVPRPMPEDRVALAIANAPRRVLPWLLLAGWSGLRAKEIAALEVTDFTVDETGAVWVRVVGKGSHVRVAPVPAWAWDWIGPLLPASGPCWARERGTGPVTPRIVSGASNDYLHKLGIPDTLHSLRHRAGTLTYRATRDIRLTQELLGHATARTTELYTRVEPGDIAAAVGALPPPPTTPRAARHLHAVPDTTAGGTA